VTPERWRQVNDLFHAALKHDPERRREFLASAAHDDPQLVSEVESLLDSHDTSGGFLETPAWGVAADLILDDEPLAGREIGPYRVLHEIGRGGMGIVYAAEDTRLGRRVALKALPPEYTQDLPRRERLTREARAAAALSHPAVATIFALEDIEGTLFLVSELVVGETLRDELREGALPADILLPTLTEIASGLAAAHAAGIVHRDLKPENIVRRTDGQVKILDFGVARVDQEGSETALRLTETGMAIGTPGYMAPEQLAGSAVGARADVFAFGVLGWELATGEHPFGTSSGELLARMTSMMEGGSPALSTPLSVEGLDAILRRCMRTDPASRYPSAEELCRDLRALAGRTPSGTIVAQSAPQASLWWWQFHQALVATVNALMPVAAWFIRPLAPRPFGAIAFFGVLALATISVTLRLNLLFTSRVHPSMLRHQRARTYSSIAAVEAVLAMWLLGCAAVAAGPNDGLAALLVTLAIVTVASLGIIEPATTQGAGLSGP
jgi:eukaryotic-like serine/threonine-protein kinase